MCGLGIEFCALGGILASLYGILLDHTMIYICNTYAFFVIIWQIRVLPGTPNILKRVFMGNFATQSVLFHLILVLAKRRKIRKKIKNGQKFGYFGR